MKITYDHEVDTQCICFKETTVTTKHLAEGIAAPKRKDFKLDLPEAHRELLPSVIDLLSSYQIERHIRR